MHDHILAALILWMAMMLIPLQRMNLNASGLKLLLTFQCLISYRMMEREFQAFSLDIDADLKLKDPDLLAHNVAVRVN